MEVFMAENKADKVDFNSEEFQTDLEKKIEPNLREDPPVKKEDKKVDENKSQEPTVEEDWKKKFEDLNKDYENLGKRYDGSTKEGKRLAAIEEEYNKLKPYEPLLGRIGSDDSLQKKIESHIKGVSDEEKPSFEDVLTDEKAFTNVIATTVGAEIDKRLGIQREEDERQRRETERLARDKEFQGKYNLTDEQMGDFMDKMKGKILTHEDMYKIVYGKDIEQKKEQNAVQDLLTQLQKSGSLPRTLASLQSTPEDEKTETDEVFDSLKNTTSDVDDMLK
jgi:hypothetical protein